MPLQDEQQLQTSLPKHIMSHHCSGTTLSRRTKPTCSAIKDHILDSAIVTRVVGPHSPLDDSDLFTHSLPSTSALVPLVGIPYSPILKQLFRRVALCARTTAFCHVASFAATHQNVFELDTENGGLSRYKMESIMSPTHLQVVVSHI